MFGVALTSNEERTELEENAPAAPPPASCTLLEHIVGLALNVIRQDDSTFAFYVKSIAHRVERQTSVYEDIDKHRRYAEKRTTRVGII